MNQWSGVTTQQGIAREDHSELIDLMVPRNDIPSVSHALHSLFFFGKEWAPTLDTSKGHTVPLLEAILGGTTCKGYRPSTPLFFRGADGFIRASRETSDGGEAHVGQTLAFLGSMGVPSSQRVGCLPDTAQVRDLVFSSLCTYTSTGECEWLLMGYLYYLPPERSWTNRWGEEFSFDACATSLVTRPYGTGPCDGIHALEVLSIMLRADAQHDILLIDVANRVRDYLSGASVLLQQNQCRDGGWNRGWWDSELSTSSHECSLHATGHHLEWILDSPSEVQPSNAAIEHAVHACQRRLANATPADCETNICPFTHAIKAVIYFDFLESVHDQ